MRALITGVAGQTGSYLAEALVARGWECHGAVREEDGTSQVLPSTVKVHEVDLTNFVAAASLVRAVSADVIVNLAAVSSVARSWEEPVETALLNGAAVANLLAAVEGTRQDGASPHFIQASSAEIFGTPDACPQDEETLVAPTNPYGAAKAYGHLLAGAYRARGLMASSLILYNHESPRRPEHFVTRKITAGAARIARGKQEFLSLGNLDARRDWGWAPDFAEAIALVAESGDGDDFVVATGEDHSVRDFALRALEQAGVESADDRLKVDPRFVRPLDAHQLVGDAAKIRKKLGWAPTRTFDEVVSAMVRADLRALDGV